MCIKSWSIMVERFDLIFMKTCQIWFNHAFLPACSELFGPPTWWKSKTDLPLRFCLLCQFRLLQSPHSNLFLIRQPRPALGLVMSLSSDSKCSELPLSDHLRLRETLHWNAIRKSFRSDVLIQGNSALKCHSKGICPYTIRRVLIETSIERHC